MKVLLVGAGAVGQVYGYHLQRGGARVGFLVKEKYAAECRAGLTIYPLNRSKGERFAPLRFADFDVLSDPAQVGHEWDAVMLCVSSTQLRGPWFDALTRAMRDDATLVMLQPGLEDKAYICERIDGSRLVAGMISLISYQAPLPGETTISDPGIAYWFPPMAPSPFSGPEERVAPLVAALKAGGCPAKRTGDVTRRAGFPTAMMMPILVALEDAEWSFKQVFQGDRLALALSAAAEAIRVVSAIGHQRRPFSRLLLRRSLLRFVAWLAKRQAPFEMEVYLKHHFTKVGDQTRFFIRRYLDLALEHDLPAENLTRLAGLLRDTG